MEITFGFTGPAARMRFFIASLRSGRKARDDKGFKKVYELGQSVYFITRALFESS